MRLPTCRSATISNGAGAGLRPAGRGAGLAEMYAERVVTSVRSAKTSWMCVAASGMTIAVDVFAGSPLASPAALRFLCPPGARLVQPRGSWSRRWFGCGCLALGTMLGRCYPAWAAETSDTWLKSSPLLLPSSADEGGGEHGGEGGD